MFENKKYSQNNKNYSKNFRNYLLDENQIFSEGVARYFIKQIRVTYNLKAFKK